MYPAVVSPVERRRRIRAALAAPAQDKKPAAPPAVAVSGLRSAMLTGAPLILADLVAVLLSTFIAAQLARGLWPALELNWAELVAALVVGSLLANLAVGLYPGIGISPITEVRQAANAAAIVCPVFLLAALFVEQAGVPVLFVILASCTLLTINLPVIRGAARTLLSRFGWWGQPALIVGNGAVAASVFRHLNHNPRLGLRPVGIVGGDDEPLHRDHGHRDREHRNQQPRQKEHRTVARNYLGPMSGGNRLLDQLGHPWLIVTAPDRSRANVDQWGAAGLYPTMISYVDGSPSLWRRASSCLDWPGTQDNDSLSADSGVTKLLKRAIDLSLTLIGGTLLLPFLLIIAALIKLSSPGPVIFRQRRVGYRGNEFVCWKFRTMVCNGDQVLAEYLQRDPEARELWNRDHKLRHDPRVTGIGKLLRKTSLDELPQLWNVLLGEMSLVGPRPIVPAEIPDFGSSFKAFCSVLPGITGLWQVSGRNHTTYSEHVELDRYYAENYSLWLDIYILILTIKVVLFRQGAY